LDLPEIPSLETERLTLRGPRIEDFPDSLAMWSDPEVTRFIGGKPSTEEEVWARLMRYVGHWALLHFGYWVVREKASGRFVGEVGFADLHRGLGKSFDHDRESGWALATWARRKGYATEAVNKALYWNDLPWGSKRTVCMIAQENRASIDVAERCGYRLFGAATYKGERLLLFERLAHSG